MISVFVHQKSVALSSVSWSSYLLVIESALFKQAESVVGVAELPYEQEVHLAHGVAHVLRTEQTLVRAPSRLYRLHLPVNIGKELF